MTTIDGSTIRKLAGRARGVVPHLSVVPFQVFLGDPGVAKVVTAIQDGTSVEV